MSLTRVQTLRLRSRVVAACERHWPALSWKDGTTIYGRGQNYRIQFSISEVYGDSYSSRIEVFVTGSTSYQIVETAGARKPHVRSFVAAIRHTFEVAQAYWEQQIAAHDEFTSAIAAEVEDETRDHTV